MRLAKAAIIAFPVAVVAEIAGRYTTYGAWWRGYIASALAWRARSTSLTVESHQEFINKFIDKYKIDTSEFLKAPSEFQTFSEFFTRELKPRDIKLDESAIFSPSDATLMSLRKIESDEVMVVKKRGYVLSELLRGDNAQLTPEEIDQVKLNPENDLYSAVFFMGLGDYHRVHAPTKFNINRFTYIKGDRRDLISGWEYSKMVI